MSFWDYLYSPDFIAGCFAGSAGIIATQPLDTIRIRKQLFVAQNMSVAQHFKKIVRFEGVAGLFRGVASPTLTVGLMSAILFQSFESTKTVIANYKQNRYDLSETPPPTYADMMMAGIVAGVVSCSITSPTELIKILVQERTDAGSATIRQELTEARHLVQHYGLAHGLYRGLHVTIARDAVAFAVYFPLYEYILTQFDIERKTVLVPFIGGGIAGLVSWGVAYPIDHVKTYYQSRKYMYGKIPLHQAVSFHATQVHGYRYLYKGLNATIWRAAPQHAVVFVIYEEVRKFLYSRKGIDLYGTTDDNI